MRVLVLASAGVVRVCIVELVRMGNPDHALCENGKEHSYKSVDLLVGGVPFRWCSVVESCVVRHLISAKCTFRCVNRTSRHLLARLVLTVSAEMQRVCCTGRLASSEGRWRVRDFRDARVRQRRRVEGRLEEWKQQEGNGRSDAVRLLARGILRGV